MCLPPLAQATRAVKASVGSLLEAKSLRLSARHKIDGEAGTSPLDGEGAWEDTAASFAVRTTRDSWREAP